MKTRTILTYDDVVTVEAGDSTEPLVDVRTYDQTIISQYQKEDMLEITGDVIYVRDSLARKLAQANQTLREKSLVLKVVYGYRHPKVQAKYFEKRKNEIAAEYPELRSDELDRLTHNFVAVPAIGGHPAAAAVDLTIYDLTTEKDLNMGTNIADYTDPLLIQTFDKRVDTTTLKYRLLLHDTMVAQNFAPFYGEWWHFSYGDREWAKFYSEKALYGAVEFATRY